MMTRIVAILLLAAVSSSAHAKRPVRRGAPAPHAVRKMPADATASNARLEAARPAMVEQAGDDEVPGRARK